MPTKVIPAESEAETQSKPNVAAVTNAAVAKRTYKITRGIWSVVDDETGERLTYIAGELIELTAEEYERNKRNLIVV